MYNTLLYMIVPKQLQQTIHASYSLEVLVFLQPFVSLNFGSDSSVHLPTVYTPNRIGPLPGLLFSQAIPRRPKVSLEGHGPGGPERPWRVRRRLFASAYSWLEVRCPTWLRWRRRGDGFRSGYFAIVVSRFRIKFGDHVHEWFVVLWRRYPMLSFI